MNPACVRNSLRDHKHTFLAPLSTTTRSRDPLCRKLVSNVGRALGNYIFGDPFYNERLSVVFRRMTWGEGSVYTVMVAPRHSTFVFDKPIDSTHAPVAAKFRVLFRLNGVSNRFLFVQPATAMRTVQFYSVFLKDLDDRNAIKDLPGYSVEFIYDDNIELPFGYRLQ